MKIRCAIHNKQKRYGVCYKCSGINALIKAWAKRHQIGLIALGIVGLCLLMATPVFWWPTGWR
ncbi:MAG: hypothetical protein ACP6IY_11035 [Promethearchaeia archaeon]